MIYGECVTDECEAERNWRGKFSSVTDWSTAGDQGKLVFLVSTEEVSGKSVDDAGNYRNKEYFDNLAGVLICAINYVFRFFNLP